MKKIDFELFDRWLNEEIFINQKKKEKRLLIYTKTWLHKTKQLINLKKN